MRPDVLLGKIRRELGKTVTLQQLQEAVDSGEIPAPMGLPGPFQVFCHTCVPKVMEWAASL